MTGTSAPRIPSGDPRRPAMPPTATPHKKGSGEERERKRERRSGGKEKKERKCEIDENEREKHKRYVDSEITERP